MIAVQEKFFEAAQVAQLGGELTDEAVIIQQNLLDTVARHRDAMPAGRFGSPEGIVDPRVAGGARVQRDQRIAIPFWNTEGRHAGRPGTSQGRGVAHLML